MNKDDLILDKLHELSSDIKELRAEQKVLAGQLIKFDCCLQNIVDKNKNKEGWSDHIKKSSMAIPFSIVTSILITLLTVFFK